MLLKLSSLMIPEELETDGAWKEYPAWDGVAFHVKSITCPVYKAALKAAQKADMASYGPDIPDAVTFSTMGRVLAETILNNWRGFVTAGNKPLAYSKETALEYLSNPEYRVVTGAVLWCAEALSVPKLEFVDPDKGKGTSK